MNRWIVGESKVTRVNVPQYLAAAHYYLRYDPKSSIRKRNGIDKCDDIQRPCGASVLTSPFEFSVKKTEGNSNFSRQRSLRIRFKSSEWIMTLSRLTCFHFHRRNFSWQAREEHKSGDASYEVGRETKQEHLVGFVAFHSKEFSAVCLYISLRWIVAPDSIFCWWTHRTRRRRHIYKLGTFFRI